MNVIAVDDERMALELLVSAVKACDSSLQIHEFRNPSEALHFAESEKCDIAFLDINMFEMSGIELARALQELNEEINIIFITGYSEYALDAFDIHASGFVTKPVTVEKVARELNHLRNRIKRQKQRVFIRCFGNFEIFVDEEVLNFSYGRTKELLAYLVDRKGTSCKTQEITAALWEEGNHDSYFRNIRKDLIDTFKKKGLSDLIDNHYGSLRIRMDLLDCDYYDYLHGINNRRYTGEYMIQYSWAEATNAWLLQNKID